jgi:predicted ATP-grasp superfamily ATP-dependent carboligase
VGKVLITGGLQRKSLAAAWCLADYGHEVHVGESSWLAPGLWSKHCHRRIIYPSILDRPTEHLAFLRSLLERETYDLVLCCNEDEVHLYAEHLDELGRFARFALPSQDTLVFAKDKSQTIVAAERCGVPHPRTWSPRSEAALDAALREVELPIVIKPRTASGARGLSIVRERSGLRERYLDTHARYPWPILQEYIPSDEAGNVTVVVLGRSQELLACFSYVRLREFPVAAGASTFVESVRRPDQEALAVKLLRGIGWTGIAMVEFRRDRRDGVPKVIEINERLNASTRLSYLAGVPIPQILYDLYVHGTATPVLDYRVGVRCRWLIPADLLHFLTNPNRFHLEPSFFEFREPNTYYEFSRRDGWGPPIAWLLWMLVRSVDPAQWRDFIFRERSRRT